MNYVICDIDGTVADSTHRRHHIHLEVGREIVTPEGTKGVIRQIDASDPMETYYFIEWFPTRGMVRMSYTDIAGWCVDWDAWDAETLADTPIAPVVKLIKMIRPALVYNGQAVMFLTARGERARALTDQWLTDHGLYKPWCGDELVMRKTGDTRKDSAAKVELIHERRSNGDEFLFALEDRASVAKVFRDLGIFTFHVADYD